jgi:hypothetical protein
MQGKDLELDADGLKDYIPFIVNRAISYHKDCVFFANFLNERPNMPKEMQLDFLRNTVVKRRRSFQKWIKPEKIADIEVVKAAYGFSTNKAKEALELLTDDDLNLLRLKTNTGGVK